MEPTAAQLATLPFLRGLSWPHLEALSACAMQVRFEAGDYIFRTDDPANRFYLLLSGKVQLEAPRPNAAPIAVQIVEAGDVVGWSWLFPPHFWRFDARTLEPTEAIFFYGTRLREAAETDPELCCALMKRMSAVLLQRLQATRQKLVSQATDS